MKKPILNTGTLLAIFGSCALGRLAAAPAATDPGPRVRSWQEDLDCFARELPARHKDFYLLLPKNKFDSEIRHLRRDIPHLSDADIILELSRITARLGVGHTKVDLRSGNGPAALHVYPLQMRWFSDGLAVVATAPEYQAALGNRVVRIGSLAPPQVEAAVATYFPHENEAALHQSSPSFMNVMEVMRREKIADASGHLLLTCARTDGQELTLDIAPPPLGGNKPKLVTSAEAFHIPTGLCRKQPKSNYWYEYLGDTGALYIQYNRCRDEPGHPFAGFAQQLFAFADSQPVERVIVDLRFNGGGDNAIVRPLVDGLSARPALSASGHLFALTDGATFSAGMWAAHGLRKGPHAILVGQPSGNKLNHYGLMDTFKLPNSKLSVNYSRKRFRLTAGPEPSTLTPDITVPYALADFLAGRDPALDTALHRPLP